MTRRPAARLHRPEQNRLRVFALLGIAAPGLHVAPARATPELVLLLRHGHKSGEAGYYNLSPQGFERAVALATLLPRCLGRPNQIRTFYLDPESGKNARTYQTAVPLAVATGLNISIDTASRENSFRSGRRILTDPSFDGRRVVALPGTPAAAGAGRRPGLANDGTDRQRRL
jgi:broad specificity phosphatase PhoE